MEFKFTTKSLAQPGIPDVLEAVKNNVEAHVFASDNFESIYTHYPTFL
ncbi:hypothetical protein OAF16_03360 [Flavobacteriales bacterium]|nr:hypothetical protein [Flavobacteriales bacterium]